MKSNTLNLNNLKFLTAAVKGAVNRCVPTEITVNFILFFSVSKNSFDTCLILCKQLSSHSHSRVVSVCFKLSLSYERNGVITALRTAYIHLGLDCGV